jgi:hypothetical protein
LCGEKISQNISSCHELVLLSKLIGASQLLRNGFLPANSLSTILGKTEEYQNEKKSANVFIQPTLCFVKISK